MYKQLEKPKKNTSSAGGKKSRSVAQKKSKAKQSFGVADNSADSIAQKKLQKINSNNDLKENPTIQLLQRFKSDLKRNNCPDIDSTKVVQRKISEVFLANDNTVRTKRNDHRPQGNLNGQTGDHTTPYVTFDHQIMAAVYGQDLPTAWNSLVVTYDEIRDMPGYKRKDSYIKNQFEELRKEIREKNKNDIGVKDILHYGNRIIEVRNMLRYTAYKTNGASTGGKNEAVAKALLLEEVHIDGGGNPKYTAEEIMTTMWNLFDHQRMKLSIPEADREFVLEQHRQSMLSTYWRVVKAYKITDNNLNEFYKQKYL